MGSVSPLPERPGDETSPNVQLGRGRSVNDRRSHHIVAPSPRRRQMGIVLVKASRLAFMGRNDTKGLPHGHALRTSASAAASPARRRADRRPAAPGARHGAADGPASCGGSRRAGRGRAARRRRRHGGRPAPRGRPGAPAPDRHGHARDGGPAAPGAVLRAGGRGPRQGAAGRADGGAGARIQPKASATATAACWPTCGCRTGATSPR